MGRKSFTLIELLVVIAIIAILAAIVAPNAFRAIEKAKISATIADVRSIRTGAMAYYADTGTWPAMSAVADIPPCTAVPGFAATDGRTNWDGPYLEKWPATAKWGGCYQWCVVTNATIGWCGLWDTDLQQERYIRISNVPLPSAQRIDQELDGVVNPGVGNVRYPVEATTAVSILVSDD